MFQISEIDYICTSAGLNHAMHCRTFLFFMIFIEQSRPLKNLIQKEKPRLKTCTCSMLSFSTYIKLSLVLLSQIRANSSF